MKYFENITAVHRPHTHSTAHSTAHVVNFCMLPHLFLAGVVLSGATQPLYRDATQPVNVRVSDLLSKMNIEEKVAQLLNPFSSGTMGLHCALTPHSRVYSLHRTLHDMGLRRAADIYYLFFLPLFRVSPPH